MHSLGPELIVNDILDEGLLGPVFLNVLNKVRTDHLGTVYKLGG